MNRAFLLLITVCRTNVHRDANSFLEHCFTYKKFFGKKKLVCMRITFAADVLRASRRVRGEGTSDEAKL